MIQTVRSGANLLSDRRDLVVGFFHSQINQDGGFRDRVGKSDLYYSVFGFEALLAMTGQDDLPVEAFEGYLCTFDNVESMDFIELVCLARCWANLPHEKLEPAVHKNICARLEGYRSGDGGYSAKSRAEHGTAYGCFLALGAYQDLNIEPPDRAGLTGCIRSLQTTDGAFANDHGLTTGATPATAAAITALYHLGEPIDKASGQWLLSQVHSTGGLLAVPEAPLPDLLSTATALHALSLMGMPVCGTGIKQPSLRFVESLWSGKGGFHGNWLDEVLDCEYTYYGLLAMGHLGVDHNQ